MLFRSVEVFTQGVRMAQLDRPYTGWPSSVTLVPANAMHLREHGRITIGGPANLVLFRARKYSELLSRPQTDRVGFPTFYPCPEDSGTDILVHSLVHNFHALVTMPFVDTLI